MSFLLSLTAFLKSILPALVFPLLSRSVVILFIQAVRFGLVKTLRSCLSKLAIPDWHIPMPLLQPGFWLFFLMTCNSGGIGKINLECERKGHWSICSSQISLFLPSLLLTKNSITVFWSAPKKGVGNIFSLVNSVTAPERTLSVFCFLKHDVYFCGNITSI